MMEYTVYLKYMSESTLFVFISISETGEWFTVLKSDWVFTEKHSNNSINLQYTCSET